MSSAKSDRDDSVDGGDGGCGEPISPETKKITLVDSGDTEFLVHQVAGHAKIGAGILKHKNGFVMKQKQEGDSRGERELTFYRKVYEAENGIPTEIRRRLQDLTPSFLGVSNMASPNSLKATNEFLMLQDVVDGFKKPCVIDLKIGAQTWNPGALPSKIEAEMKKYSGTKQSLGISMAGLYYFDVKSQQTIRKERHFGRDLNHDTLYEAIKEFLNYGNSERSQIVVLKILQKLKKVKEFFEVQDRLAFYSSSILITYDAIFLEEDTTNLHPGEDETDWVRAFMIDFAHVFELDKGKSRDDNYLFGLNNVIKLIEAIKNNEQRFNTINEEKKNSIQY